jgi:signal transduction histidine kinase
MVREDTERFSPRTAIAEASQALLPPQRELNAPAPSWLIDNRVLELLTARLCHELSGPIAAINNGVELLTEDDPGAGSLPNPALLHDAVTLVGASAQRARSLGLWNRRSGPL